MVMKKSLLSVKRKPLSNRISKKSPMPDSSSGSITQTRFHPAPPTPTSDDWVGDRNHIARRQTMQKTRTHTKVVTNVPVYSVHVEKTNNTKRSIEDVPMTVSGVKVSDEGTPIVLPLGFSQKCKGKEVEVATPINSAPPLRIKCHRNEVDRAKDAMQSKPLTDPLPNNKKKELLSKGSSRKFVMPYDFIDQQRAYFKEIDEYKLHVEEVDQVSVYEE